MAFQPFRQILTLTDLISKIVRDNFDDAYSYFQDLQNQINLLLTPPAGNEVTNARDFHTVLRDRLRSASVPTGNYLVSGGVVSEQGTPNMTIVVSAGEAIIAGVAVKWGAVNSPTITAPGSNTRLDYIVVDSGGSVTVVAGIPGASPYFGSISDTQLVLGALVVKNTTTALRNKIEVFTFTSKRPFTEDFYIGSAAAMNQGVYNVENLIIDAAITSDLNASGIDGLNDRFMQIKCAGHFYMLSAGSIAITNSAPSYFENGANSIHGCGGGASCVANGGNGIGGVGGIGGKLKTSAGIGVAFVAGRAGSSLPNSTAGSLFEIIAKSIYIAGTIDNNGGDGAPNSTEGASGAGAIFLIAKDDVSISGTINAYGGDPKPNAPSLGGKGGGAGGLVVIRSTSYTLSGSIVVLGGPAGAGTTPGDPGGNGVVDQKLWPNVTSIGDTRNPLPFVDNILSTLGRAP